MWVIITDLYTFTFVDYNKFVKIDLKAMFYIHTTYCAGQTATVQLYGLVLYLLQSRIEISDNTT